MTLSKSILVVEDDPDQAAEMADALIRAGYAVRTASSGDVAFAELLSVPPPSLAIVDCHLPDRSGLSIMRLTLGAGGGIPFVLVTGEPELPDGAAGLSNAVTFWRKPLDMRALVDLVKSLIGTAVKPAA
jgi:DNA-binding response OmpR family regulator